MLAALTSSLSRSSGRTVLYAPSLLHLPIGAPMVVATLPVVDWNSALVEACAGTCVPPGAEVYAGILATDPFACWDDVADVLTRARITGVSNFPSTALMDGSMANLATANLGYERELDRLAWFAQRGFNVLGTVATFEHAEAIKERLGSRLTGIYVTRPGDLDRRIEKSLPLESVEGAPWAAREVPVLKLGG